MLSLDRKNKAAGLRIKEDAHDVATRLGRLAGAGGDLTAELGSLGIDRLQRLAGSAQGALARLNAEPRTNDDSGGDSGKGAAQQALEATVIPRAEDFGD